MKKILFCLLLLSFQALSQTTRSFDVATIKPSGPLDTQKLLSGQVTLGITITKGRVTVGFMPLSALLMQAYKIKPHQISGPAWLNEDRFDITATLPEGATEDQVPEMMQSLLRDRFGLAFHWNTEEKAIYALQVDKDGPKLKVAEEPKPPTGTEPKPDMVLGSGDNAVSMRQAKDGSVSISNSKNGAMNVVPGPNGSVRLEIGKMSMAEFAEGLTQMVDRPVVDKTELKGNYQIALEMSMTDMIQIARKSGALSALGPEASAAVAQIPGASDPSSNSVMKSVQKLGLRLEPQKASVQVLVVDKISRTATEN